jgi:hypothetical protein
LSLVQATGRRGRIRSPGPSGSRDRRNRTTFAFKLERPDGTPADPPTIRSAVPNWKTGDTIPMGRDRTLRVVGIVAPTGDESAVLVVEDMVEQASSAGA